MSHRKGRLASDLAQRIARILATRVSDPRLEGVTVVNVDAAPDGSFARVFYRTFGDQEAAAEALAKAKPYIRRRLGEGLRLRRVPELDFRYDPSQAQGARVDEILRELAENGGEGTGHGRAREPDGQPQRQGRQEREEGD